MNVKNVIKEFISERFLHDGHRISFEIDIPVDLHTIANAFRMNDHDIYVVGGAVRDALLGIEPKDFDIATDAVPDDVVKIIRSLPEHKIVEVGKSFGVVKVVTPSKNEYEIATFRRDVGVGRRPDSVEFTSIKEDVFRRDLTINALFYDIDKSEIVDYVGGINDIKLGIVRTVGDPVERFSEDRLRIFRALRFAARMGSDIDERTANAIRDNNSLAGVSAERIRDEFLKGVKSAKSVARFLDLIDSYDLWPQVFPGLIVSRVDVETRNTPVLLARLLWGNDSTKIFKNLIALKYTSQEASQVSFLFRFKSLDVNNSYRTKKAFYSSHLSNFDIIEFSSLKNTPEKSLVDAFIKYELAVSGAELTLEGFSGKFLGDELERREVVRFKELLESSLDDNQQ